MFLTLAVLVSMLNEDTIEVAVAAHIKAAYNAECAEEAGHHRDRAAALLDLPRANVDSFCSRFIKGARHEFELGTALGIASRVERSHSALALYSIELLRNDALAVHYKRAACTVIAKHSTDIETAAIDQLIKALPSDLAVSLSGQLIVNLSRFRAEDRLTVLLLSMKISNSKILRDRRHFMDAPIVVGRQNEELYNVALKEEIPPHYRAILMMALLELDGKKYVRLEKELENLANGDSLTAWYYEQFLSIYRP